MIYRARGDPTASMMFNMGFKTLESRYKYIFKVKQKQIT